jgi:Carboxypeptidase regulatory-like domain
MNPPKPIGYLLTVLIAVSFLSLKLMNVVGQVPVGTVAGSVSDSAAALIVGAQVTIRQDGTGLVRNVLTDGDGVYRFVNLPPGNFVIEAKRQGFKTEWRRLTLRVGDNLVVDFSLQPGSPSERVQITSEVSGVNTTDYRVAGTVSRVQFDNLPLNGRSFLELAQLEPGVQVSTTTNPGGLGNVYTQVQFGGAYYSQTHVGIDGSTIGDRFTGGTTQTLSQESVQEFQVSSFNLDLSTGNGATGSINIVTRHGSNDLHGSAFYYFRDHNLAAYPGLRRDAKNPSPFFARRQMGFSVGGPIKRDRLFWFTNYEHNNQDAVFAVTNNHPIFSKFDGIYPNPLNFNQFNVRLDDTVNDRTQTFLRFSLEKDNTFAPAISVGLPSNWQSVRNRAFQIQGGVVSVLTSHLVNDFRFSHSYLGGHLDPASQDVCKDPIACLGVGGPNIVVFDAPQFRIGNQMNSPFARWLRNYQVVDNVTWERGDHRLRFGGEWQHTYQKASLAFQEPAQIVLWGPTNLQTPALLPLYNALPASLRDPNSPPPTFQELMQLPFRSFTTGIGNPTMPGPFNFDQASRNDRPRLYIQDSWRVNPKLTLSYGLAYSYESNLFDHDLDYPQYLGQLFGGRTKGPAKDKNNFDPAAGLAWSLGESGRTVIRAGAGIYRDETTLGWKARDRAFIGPSGNGRVIVDGSVTGINFVSTPTPFTGGDFLPLLPGIRANLASRFGDGMDLSVRGINVIKQGDQILDPDSTTAYAIHVNAGIQRELRPNLMLTADYVMRRMVHVGVLQGVYILDQNRFNRPAVTGVDPNTGVVSFVRNPVIPLCTPAQAIALNPADNCSTGPINVFSTNGNFRYQGLHLKLERRYSAGLQFTIGYALAKNTGFIDGGFTSFDDFSKAEGNITNHRRHRLTVSGLWSLPDYHGSSDLWRALRNSWTVSFIAQAFSAPPLDTLLNGLDLDGDGISLTLLPGTNRHNLLGQGLNSSELRQLVETYNADVESRTRRVTNPDGSITIIRPRTPFNQIINPITLPDKFSSGDSFITHDVRLTRNIKLREEVQLSVIAEAFNLLNIANLTGYSGVLNQPNYGTASARVGQVFGTGGPRAFQFAARLTF